MTLDRLDKGTQRTYTNNTPFDTYFALREEKISANNLLEIVEWYLENQNDASGCWYLNADPKMNINTWTTIEALLALSDAYDLLTEEIYLREVQQLDAEQVKYVNYTAITEKAERVLQEKYNKNIKTIKKRDKILLVTSVGISIVISIVCLIIFLIVVTKGMNSTLKTVIEVVIGGLAVNAIFQGILFVCNRVNKKVKEYDKSLEESDNINSDNQ